MLRKCFLAITILIGIAGVLAMGLGAYSKLFAAERDLGQASSLAAAADTVKAEVERAASRGDDEARFVIRYELEGPQVLRGVYLGRFTSSEAAKAVLDAEFETTRNMGNADVIAVFKLGDAESFGIVYAYGLRGAGQIFSGDEPPAEESRPTT